MDHVQLNKEDDTPCLLMFVLPLFLSCLVKILHKTKMFTPSNARNLNHQTKNQVAHSTTSTKSLNYGIILCFGTFKSWRSLRFLALLQKPVRAEKIDTPFRGHIHNKRFKQICVDVYIYHIKSRTQARDSFCRFNLHELFGGEKHCLILDCTVVLKIQQKR